MAYLIPSAIRTEAEVAGAVDEKLGRGEGLMPLAAYELLEGAERVHWILGELMYGTLQERFHIWIQSQAQRDFDGPRHVAMLAPIAREIDPLVGDLMAWTAERGRAVRAEERGEALISFVPRVWVPARERVLQAMTALVERWPDGLDPSELPEPAPYKRGTRDPQEQGIRYPECSVGYTEGKPGYAGCGERVASDGDPVDATALALWKHGASDAEIEGFLEATGSSTADLPAVLAAWVSFDGDGGDEARFAAMRRAQDPVAVILGIETSAQQAIVRIQGDRFEEIGEKLQPFGAQVIRPDADADFVMRVRSALRMGDAFLVVQAIDMTEEEDVDLLWQAIHTGMTVVLAGSSPSGEALVDRVKASGPG